MDLFALALKLQSDTLAAKKALADVDAAGKQTASTLTKTEGAAASVGRASTTAAQGLTQVQRQMAQTATQALGLQGAAGNVSQELGAMSLGGATTVGLLAGLAAISLAFRGAVGAWNDLERESEELISSLARQGKAFRDAGADAARATLDFAKANLASVRASQSATGSSLIGGLKAGLGMAVGGQSFGLGYIGGGEALRQAMQLQNAIDAVTGAQKALADAEGKTARSAIDANNAQISAMTQLISLGAATNGQRQQAILLLKGLKDSLNALPINDTIGRAGLAGQIKELNDALFPKLHEHLKKLKGELTPLAKSPQIAQTYSEIAAGDLPDLGPLKPIKRKTPDLPQGQPARTPGQVPTPAQFALELEKLLQDYREQAIQQFENLGIQISQGIAQTIGDAVYNGFAAAFDGKGIGGIFEAFGKTVLAGIGQIFAQMGQVYIAYGIAMSGLAPSLANPFVAGPTAIAIGVLLEAMAAGLGAVAKGSGRGSASAGAFREPSNGTSDVVRLKFVDRPGMNQNLVPAPNVTINAYGPNDPKTQRWMLETFSKAQRRG